MSVRPLGRTLTVVRFSKLAWVWVKSWARADRVTDSPMATQTAAKPRALIDWPSGNGKKKVRPSLYLRGEQKRELETRRQEIGDEREVAVKKEIPERLS